jgi:ABC-2 type transport system permease protein
MRALRFLLQKEFKQIFRDRIILAMMLVMPSAQLIVLPLAADYEVRNVQVAVIDHDHSTTSRRLVDKIAHGAYFKLVQTPGTMTDAMRGIEANTIDVALEIPAGFERGLARDARQTLFMAVNAINGVKANIGAAYLSRVIQDHAAGLRLELLPDLPSQAGIDLRTIDRFNPHLNYRTYMVPGILALLLTMIAVYLSALNIVREKEIGTIEQLNVTPLTKLQFITGKLIPFWVLGLVVFSIGLLLARLVYGIVPVGSIGVLYLFAGIYIIAVLGLGLLISTIAATQQQAMFVAFFFMMIFIMMGGLFTSIDSMPAWAQWITRFNPVRYIIDVMRMVVLKGSTLHDIRHHLLIIAGFAVVLNTLAIVSYRKTSS